MRNHQKEAAIIFIDFKKTFHSEDRNKVFPIFHAHGIPEKIVKAIQIIYVNTSAVVLTPEEETTNFNINTGVLQGDPVAPYLFIIVLDYTSRTAIDDREELTRTRLRSTIHPASYLSNLDYADDIALFAETIQEAELLLHKVESASKSTGLFRNPPKKYRHINPPVNDSVHSSDQSKIEKVEDF